MHDGDACVLHPVLELGGDRRAGDEAHRRPAFFLPSRLPGSGEVGRIPHTDWVEDDRRDLWQLIESLTEQVKTAQADMAALVTRADVSEARADQAEARADQADIRADIGDVRVDKIEAAERVDREMIAELQADGELSREHAKQLEQALRSSRVIGAAVGMLMASRNLSEDQAFAVLTKASQDSNQKLRHIAQLLVRGTSADDLRRKDSPDRRDH